MNHGKPTTKPVLVTGCFDLAHVGHVELIRTAATYGPVFVGINDDASVRYLKGDGRPINKDIDRLTVMSAFHYVTYAFLIHAHRVDRTIRSIRPAFWIKGGDYTLETLDKDEVAAAREVGAEIVIVPLLKGYSTTETLKKLEGK